MQCTPNLVCSQAPPVPQLLPECDSKTRHWDPRVSKAPCPLPHPAHTSHNAYCTHLGYVDFHLRGAGGAHAVARVLAREGHTGLERWRCRCFIQPAGQSRQSLNWVLGGACRAGALGLLWPHPACREASGTGGDDTETETSLPLALKISSSLLQGRQRPLTILAAHLQCPGSMISSSKSTPQHSSAT